MQIDITGNTYADLYTDGKKKIADDITSQLENNSLSGYAVFLVPDRNGYGFWAYLIDKEVRTDDEGKAIRRFCLKKKQYCSFEKEELVTFFDGKR